MQINSQRNRLRRIRAHSSSDSRLPGELPPIGSQKSQKNWRKTVQRSQKPPRGIYTAIIILLICAVVMAVWVNRESLKPENISEWMQTEMLGLGTGNGYPLHLSSENIMPRNFMSAGKNIFLTSDTAIEAYNGSAKQLFSKKHSFSDPVMNVSGNRVLVYNLGGTGYRLENQLKTLVSDSADGKLLGGAVCSNGRYALLTQQDGYCGKLTVYLQNGQTAYEYSFSEYYPTAVALNDSGTQAAVTAVGTSGGEMVSVVYKLDFNSSSLVKPTASYSDTVFLDVAYTDTGGILAVGDKQTAAMDASGKALHAYHYDGGELSAWNLSSGMAVLGLSKFHNAANSSLTAINLNGNLIGSAQVDGTISSVSRFGNKMAALSEGTVHAFTDAGQPAGSCSAGSNARAIALRSGNEAFVLEVSEIKLEKLE
ncbi:MAG TPA: hypothetical protein DHW78_10745 [Ruminococcaceae bacterium]|nr:hypothetical protein [Oscillospiraceae bacterium]